METKTTSCVCGNQIEYKASDIIRKEVPGEKNVLGGNTTEIERYVQCRCGKQVEIFDRMNAAGGFL